MQGSLQIETENYCSDSLLYRAQLKFVLCVYLRFSTNEVTGAEAVPHKGNKRRLSGLSYNKLLRLEFRFPLECELSNTSALFCPGLVHGGLR